MVEHFNCSLIMVYVMINFILDAWSRSMTNVNYECRKSKQKFVAMKQLNKFWNSNQGHAWSTWSTTWSSVPALVVKCVCTMRIAIREFQIREFFWPFWRMRKNSFVEIRKFYKIESNYHRKSFGFVLQY